MCKGCGVMRKQKEVEDHSLRSRGPHNGVGHILTLRDNLILLVTAIILFLLLASCAPSTTAYRVSNVRMAYCGETENICTLNSISQFEAGANICFAWTDVNRGSSDSLSIFVYNNGRRVYDINDQEELIESNQECRVIPIETTLSSGHYQTEFAVNGRPVDAISWEIKQPPTPTPMAAPPYDIENPRMTICKSDVNVCLLEGVSQFSLTDEICTAWTEVNRNPNDSFAFFVYDEKNKQIRSYVESTTDSAISQRCRVEQIDNPNVSGTYRTEFTANGRPAEKILWSISPSRTLYHMKGEIGCVDRESTIFFEGDVDPSINDGEFLIRGKGTDYSPTIIIYVEVDGKFTGKEIASGEIRLYSESYKEDGQNTPFRIDAFDGLFQDLELYAEATPSIAGCDIFTRIYLEEPTVGSTTEPNECVFPPCPSP